MNVDTFMADLFEDKIPHLTANSTAPIYDNLALLQFLSVDGFVVVDSQLNGKAFTTCNNNGHCFYVEFKLGKAPIVNTVLNYINRDPMFFTLSDPDKFTGSTESLFFTIKNKPDLLYNPYSDKKIHVKADIKNLIDQKQLDVLTVQHEADQMHDSLEEINEESYMWKLECLPPLKWGINNGINSFFMCEFWSGSLTEQVATVGDRYFKKLVDYKNPNTWLNAPELNKLIEG